MKAKSTFSLGIFQPLLKTKGFSLKIEETHAHQIDAECKHTPYSNGDIPGLMFYSCGVGIQTYLRYGCYDGHYGKLV